MNATLYYISQMRPLRMGHEQPAPSQVYFMSFEAAVAAAWALAEEAMADYGEDDLWLEAFPSELGTTIYVQSPAGPGLEAFRVVAAHPATA